MGAQISQLPPTQSGSPSMLPTERFDHNKLAVKQDKARSSKMKDENVEKARNLKPVKLEKFHEHLLNRTLYFCFCLDTYEFEKETVVQLWVAEGFFKPKEGDRVEDLANSHFDYLIEKKYVSPSGFSSIRRYKITDVIHRSLQNAPQLGYLKVREAQLGSVSENIQHLFLISRSLTQQVSRFLAAVEV